MHPLVCVKVKIPSGSSHADDLSLLTHNIFTSQVTRMRLSKHLLVKSIKKHLLKTSSSKSRVRDQKTHCLIKAIDHN